MTSFCLRCVSAVGVRTCRRRQLLVGVVVRVYGENHLLEVVRNLSTCVGLMNSSRSRHEKGDQDRENCNDDKRLEKGNSAAWRASRGFTSKWENVCALVDLTRTIERIANFITLARNGPNLNWPGE